MMTYINQSKVGTFLKRFIFLLFFVGLVAYSTEYDPNHECRAVTYLSAGIQALPVESDINVWDLQLDYDQRVSICNTRHPVPFTLPSGDIATELYAAGSLNNLLQCVYIAYAPYYGSIKQCILPQILQAETCECCSEPDISFPPLPQQYVSLFEWDDLDDNKSNECTAHNGTKQTVRTLCQTQYRCIKPTDEPSMECKEETGSYVTPGDGVFHEDIAIDGISSDLHYQSANITIGDIAPGWSISSHAILKDGTLYRGNGTRYIVDTVQPENNNTVISNGADELVFDAKNNHIATRDSYTKVVQLTFTYDQNNNLTSISDRFNQTTQIVRDVNGMVESIVAPKGQVTSLLLNSNNDLESVTYEDGASYTFEYNAHLMTKEREPKGNEFVHIFDAKGKIVQVVDAELGEWNFAQENELNASLNSVLRASGDSVQYRNYYLNNGFLRSEKIQPNGDVIVKESKADDSETHVSSCGMTKDYNYETESPLWSNEVVLVKDPIEHKRVLSSFVTTTPSGLRNSKSFSTTYQLDSAGVPEQINAITIQNGNKSESITDYNQHTKTYYSPTRRTFKFWFDSDMQRLLKQALPGVADTVYTYDSEGRVTQVVQGARTSSYSYDERGNLASETNPKGETTNYTYDSRDRLNQIVYPDGHSSAFGYDANSNMTQLTTPTPTNHNFDYNGVNKQSSSQSPLGLTTQYIYDKGRRLIQTIRPSGATVTNTYTNGEMVQTQTPDKTTDITYACGGKLGTITNSDNEELSYTYDGDLVTQQQYTGVLNQGITFGYNNDFLLSSINYAGETEYLYYNRDGLLSRIGDFTISRANLTGFPMSIRGGSTYNESRAYNTYGEVDSTNINVRYETKYQNYISQRTLNGQISTRNEIVDRTNTSYAYSYDNRGRLIEVKKGGVTVESYTYDANGNRDSATVNGVTTTASYTLDDQLEVYGQNTYLYNVDGYLSEKTTPQGTTTYSYGTLGELKEVVTPTDVITYKHNANNQRVAKLKNGEVVEKYLWLNLTTLLAVFDKNGNLLQRFNYADGRMPISYKDNHDNSYYIAYNQQGSPVVVSDDRGNTLKTLSYDSFGNIISDSNPSIKIPFGFAGGLYDPDTGLTRFGYRDYDAYTGKWTAKDPIGFAGGDTNLYGYVLEDPVNFVDPTGLFTPVIGAFIGGIAGGIIGGVGAYATGGNVVNGVVVGIIAGAGAGFFAGLGAVGFLPTIYADVSAFAFDVAIHATNVIDTLNDQNIEIEIPGNRPPDVDLDLCFRRE